MNMLVGIKRHIIMIILHLKKKWTWIRACIKRIVQKIIYGQSYFNEKVGNHMNLFKQSNEDYDEKNVTEILIFLSLAIVLI